MYPIAGIALSIEEITAGFQMREQTDTYNPRNPGESSERKTMVGEGPMYGVRRGGPEARVELWSSRLMP